MPQTSDKDPLDVVLEPHNEEKIWAITINPANELQYMNNKDRLKQFVKNNHVIIHQWFSEYKYDLCIEVARSSHGTYVDGYIPRLHYHGILLMSEKQYDEFLIYKMSTIDKYYSICIKEMKTNGWVEYMNKQSESMQSLCEDVKVPYNLLYSNGIPKHKPKLNPGITSLLLKESS